jgi:hypothetical protein
MGRKKLQEKDLYMAHGNVGNLNAKKLANSREFQSHN